MLVFVGQVASVAKRGSLTIEYSYDNVNHLVSIDNAYAVWFRYVLQGIIPLIVSSCIRTAWELPQIDTFFF